MALFIPCGNMFCVVGSEVDSKYRSEGTWDSFEI